MDKRFLLFCSAFFLFSFDGVYAVADSVCLPVGGENRVYSISRFVYLSGFSGTAMLVFPFYGADKLKILPSEREKISKSY